MDANSQVFTYLGRIHIVHVFLHIYTSLPTDVLDMMSVQVCNFMMSETMLGSNENVLVFHIAGKDGAVRATCVTPTKGHASLLKFEPNILYDTLVRCLKADRSKDQKMMFVKVRHTGAPTFAFNGPLHL